MVNSIFGKTMENVEKRKDIKLCTRWKTKTRSIGAEALIAKPNFASSAIFGESLIAVQMGNVHIYYDKPLYIGFCVLDISKTVMYEFLYGYIKPKYGASVSLCYMDTDSLILEIFTDNVYDDMKKDNKVFDTSNYPPENIHNIPRTISEVGKMKDEFKGTPIKSFIGTGAKAYCVEADDVMKKAKGISKHVIKNQLQLSDYCQIVENGGIVFRKMVIFKSELHKMYTQIKNKVALSSFDDKRHVLNNGVNTLAWGHVAIANDPSTHNLDGFLEIAQEMLGSDDVQESIAAFNMDLLKPNFFL
jgi:hypothetical protein